MSDPKRDYSALFKALNPELFMKPNARVGFIGTAVAVGVCGWLYYEKRRIENERKALDNRAPRLERSLSDGSAEGTLSEALSATMALLACGNIVRWPIVCIALGALLSFPIWGPTQAADCSTGGVSVVRQLSDIPQGSYGRSGLQHMTIAGAVHHGMEEVEVWMQTFAPGVGTPIHRHECEEVFVVLKGGGSFFLGSVFAQGEAVSEGGHTGVLFEEHEVQGNSTFTVPRNATHQVVNTGNAGDLQLLVIISRPPIRVFVYDDWTMPHKEAKLRFPYPWDEVCPFVAQAKT